MKRTIIFIIFIIFACAGYSQSGFSFSKKRWDKIVPPPPPKLGLELKSHMPTSGSGLLIFGSPSFVTNFTAFPYVNGNFQSTASLTPGFEYSFNFGSYKVTPAQTNVTEYTGIGIYATAGGVGSTLKSSLAAGVSLSVSSFGQIGWGRDFINKRNEFIVGAAFPLNLVEQGIMASVFWHKENKK